MSDVDGERVFRIARNPDPDSTLPYLLWVPLGASPLVLKAKETWPRTAKVYCHRGEWPEDAEIVEETPVRACTRRGVAVDLVLDRSRETRSQFVITTLKGGREGIFWQTAGTTRKTRPGMRLPTKRSAAGELTIIVDTRERYAWKFERQQAGTEKRALVVGDYAVEGDDDLAAAQVRYPTVPIVFCENRQLAMEWTYRFLGAAARFADEEAVEL